MGKKHKDIVPYQPSPARVMRPYVWLLPICFGLCLLIAYQLSWLAASPNGERTNPTQTVVDALRPTVASSVVAAANAAVQTEEFSAAAKDVSYAQLSFLGPAGDRDRAIDCLAIAAWYEAGNQADDQRSVMQVVLNRVAHPSFPKSVCGVVFEGSHRATGCQFTFTCDGSMARRRPSRAAMERAREIAASALTGTIYPDVSKATHYHADYVSPWWSSKLVRLGKVGPHIFYRWPGMRGALSGRPSSVSEAKFAQLSYQSVRQSDSLAALSLANGSQMTSSFTATPEQAEPSADNAISVAPASEGDGTIFLVVDMAMPSGRWAILALEKCVGQIGCRILGYETQEKLVRNSTISARVREKPVFLFVRDAGSGAELALWNCEKVKRPARSQCLPNVGRELARLLRGRQG